MALAGCGGDEPDAAVVLAVVAQPCARPHRDRGVGVLLRSGLVATAAHTVDGPLRELTVDGAPAQVVILDARTDLALLSADVVGPPAPITVADIAHGTVRTPDGDHEVDVVRTGRLIVDDITGGVRHERSVHTFTPGVEPGTSGAPLVDDSGRVAGIVVLTNRTDGTAYAVTAAELIVLGDDGQSSAAPIGCPG